MYNAYIYSVYNAYMYNVMVGVAQLNAFSFANKNKLFNN